MSRLSVVVCVEFPNDAVVHVVGFPGLAKFGWVSPLSHHFYVSDGRHYEVAIVNVGYA